MTTLGALFDRLAAISTQIANERVAPYLAMRGYVALSDRERQIVLGCLLATASAVIEVPEFEAIVREVAPFMPRFDSSPET
jgi:hypothetical protein